MNIFLETEIDHNIIDGTVAGVQTEQGNQLKISCNDFDETTYALSVNPLGGYYLTAQGLTDPQEQCDVGEYRPSNNFLVPCTTPTPSHIRSTIDFVYVEDPENSYPAKLNCVVGNSLFEECGLDQLTTECPSYGDPTGTHERAGNLIGDLETEGDPLASEKILGNLMPVLLDLDTSAAVIKAAIRDPGTKMASRLLAGAFYSWGQADSVLAVLDTMALDNMEDSVFYATYLILATAQDDVRTALDLTDEELDSLLVLAAFDKAFSKIAENALQLNEVATYYVEVEQWGEEKRSDEPLWIADGQLVASPVPFSDLVTFTYPALSHGGTLVVTDIAGKELKRLRVRGSSAVVSLGDLPGGFYVAHILVDSRPASSTKLIRQ
jgi:hypothetical protein